MPYPICSCRVGGVDTFHSSSERGGGGSGAGGGASSEDVRTQVLDTAARIKETARLVALESAHAAQELRLAMAAKRDAILTGGPIRVARAALEVRQERVKRTAAKAADAARKREVRARSRGLLAGIEFDIPAGDGGGYARRPIADDDAAGPPSLGSPGGRDIITAGTRALAQHAGHVARLNRNQGAS